jgi:antitoxin component HigA of HigAB toxin-antitoxin module
MPVKTADARRAGDFGRLPKTFTGLCSRHRPRPIRTRAELRSATAMIDAMAGHQLNADQADYLDALTAMVERYESEHDPVTDRVSGPALLLSLMEANDLTTAEVAAVLDVDRSLVSHLVAGRRSMTWHHAKLLGEHFGLTPAAFME